MKYGEINLQEELRASSVLVFAFGLLLLFQNDSFAQSDKILFEITRSGFSRGTMSKDVLRIYKSGRIDCESSNRKDYIFIGEKKMLLLNFTCNIWVYVKGGREPIEKKWLVPVEPGKEFEADAVIKELTETWSQ